MSKPYRVWSPDLGFHHGDADTIDTMSIASTLHLTDAVEAAEQYVERCHEQDSSDWPRNPVDVMVRCPDGEVVAVRVTTDWDPIFSGRLVSP
jgi:uncharacterized repeat protein (TIGR04076 family)